MDYFQLVQDADASKVYCSTPNALVALSDHIYFVNPRRAKPE